MDGWGSTVTIKGIGNGIDENGLSLSLIRAGGKANECLGKSDDEVAAILLVMKCAMIRVDSGR